MSTQIPVQNGNLPSGFCPATLQAMLNGFSAAQYITLTLGAGVGIQVQASPPSNTNLPWFQLDSNGNPVRIYWFASGAWLSKHPLATGISIPWFGVLPTTFVVGGVTYTTFDEGDMNALSPISGAFWEVVSEAAARFPLACGTLPSTLVINPNDTGGEEKHILLTTELAKHHHFLANTDFGDTNTAADLSASNHMNQGAGGHSGPLDYKLKGSSDPATQGQSSEVGSDTGHNTMPPYIGMNWLRRTIRSFYAV